MFQIVGTWEGFHDEDGDVPRRTAPQLIGDATILRGYPEWDDSCEWYLALLTTDIGEGAEDTDDTATMKATPGSGIQGHDVGAVTTDVVPPRVEYRLDMCRDVHLDVAWHRTENDHG